MSGDRGNWVWFRRQIVRRECERARTENRCKKCNRKDNTGLIDGLCTKCFCAKQEAK